MTEDQQQGRKLLDQQQGRKLLDHHQQQGSDRCALESRRADCDQKDMAAPSLHAMALYYEPERDKAPRAESPA